MEMKEIPSPGFSSLKSGSGGEAGEERAKKGKTTWWNRTEKVAKSTKTKSTSASPARDEESQF